MDLDEFANSWDKEVAPHFHDSENFGEWWSKVHPLYHKKLEEGQHPFQAALEAAREVEKSG